MRYPNILEEELKNKVAQDYFADFDCTKIIGKVDFCVTLKTRTGQPELLETESLLWAEAKKGVSDVYESFVQLALTIGKARTFDKALPPAYLGAFDAETLAFLPYNDIQEVFYLNDFNWNVRPSDHNTKEFRLLYEKVQHTIAAHSLLFKFGKDDKEIREFIATNFIIGKSETSKIRIDKNNFIAIYTKWLDAVKSSISVNWDAAKKIGIIDGDFYLADLLSQENTTIKEKLYVLLKTNQYELDRKLDDMGMFSSRKASFSDNQKAHIQFWNKYERPPREEYWDYIVGRRDLLVPQDVRERKGSYFTPKIWVELSQRYLADTLGEDWQDEYYIWDCAAGTGNLLNGLTNKYNIWASTLDQQDVDVIHDRIKNGANLLDSHVFQFDFLNDDFSKLPKELQAIINDPKKREKLVMYINPPYAEASTTKQRTGTGENKAKITTETLVYQRYKSKIGSGCNELFAQFLIRIYCEIPTATIANFSTLKNLQSSNFHDFREVFRAKLEKLFLVPADTFDNVTGQFPIGFFVWNSEKNEKFTGIVADVFDKNGIFYAKKILHTHNKGRFVIDWLRKHYDKNKNSERLAFLRMQGTDMQNNRGIFITNQPSPNDVLKHLTANITKNNVFEMCIYLSIRHVIDATWLNDRDQFLYPENAWETDTEFQNNCLIFTIFHGQNKISLNGGTNHWIPFLEREVNAREKFESNFMAHFIAGKLKPVAGNGDLFGTPNTVRNTPLVFSAEAEAVLAVGRDLWTYYHAQPNCNVNASLYDIREHFQGRNAKGTMKTKSLDAQYTALIKDLREKLKVLAEKIAVKVYLYKFLM